MKKRGLFYLCLAAVVVIECVLFIKIADTPIVYQDRSGIVCNCAEREMFVNCENVDRSKPHETIVVLSCD